MQQKRLTIVNRHFPPNVNITGENAWDLAKYLIEKHDIEVAVVHIDRSFEGGGNQRKPVGKTFPIQTLYQGKNKILRYISGILDGYYLVKKAAALNHGPIIIMTSPPLLPMWASKILTKQKKEWILWSMDLFPEGFAASGEFNKRNPFYRYALKKTYQHAPNKIIALGPQQKKELDKKYNCEPETVILPCGVFVDQNIQTSKPDWKLHPDKINFGYCGNCAAPHSATFIIEIARQLDPKKHHLILAVYGSKAERIKKAVKDNPAVSIFSSIPRSELNHIDIHLVTLVNSWTHIAVPSKAISSICSGATFIFCGNKKSDNWYLLQKAGWLIEENKEMKKQIQDFISTISKKEIEQKKQEAVKLSEQLNQLIQESYDTIATWAK